MANGAFIPSLDAMTQRPAYGGVRQIRMTAPVAPGQDTAQGKVNAGQGTLPANLTMQAQQTMGVPSTPTKGLLARAMPGINNVGSMG
jgi:hypothetical protein